MTNHEAIETIKCAIAEIEWEYYPMDYAAALDKAVEALERQEWISVNDELPSIGEKVVISDGVHAWDVGQYQGLSYDAPDKWDWRKNAVRTVKWWMPKDKALPEPPREET